MRFRILSVLLIVVALVTRGIPAWSPAHMQKSVVGGMEFIYIKGGSYLMGSPEGEGMPNEHPRHKVTIHGFRMGKYEVTQKQYLNVLGNNPSTLKGDTIPVVQVSWQDAKNFCREFSKKYGCMARLPTEAEWEYACRAGTDTKFYWGDTFSDNYCWNTYSNPPFGVKKLLPVGQKLPNPWGLYDMIGNAYEWCEDWFDNNYYAISPEMNPAGPATGKCHVLRSGGDWYEDSVFRSAQRNWNCSPPTDAVNLQTVGFRVVIPETSE